MNWLAYVVGGKVNVRICKMHMFDWINSDSPPSVTCNHNRHNETENVSLQFGSILFTSYFFSQRSAFYAIFDGHAGRRAADFAADRLPSRLKRKLEACRFYL